MAARQRLHRPQARRQSRRGPVLHQCRLEPYPRLWPGLERTLLESEGREKNGIVQPGRDADALLDELSAKLLTVRDPATGLPVITRMSRTSEVYHGAFV